MSSIGLLNCRGQTFSKSLINLSNHGKQKKNTVGEALEIHLVEFATRMLDMVEALPKKATAKHLGNQVMRSGTSPALNYGEAQAAESTEDFVHG